MLCTTTEAAEIMCVSEREVRRMCERGDLRAVRHGLVWIVQITDNNTDRKEAKKQ